MFDAKIGNARGVFSSDLFNFQLNQLIRDRHEASTVGALDLWRKDVGLLPGALQPSVGSVALNPYYGGVGNVSVQPYNPGVGAPVEEVPMGQGVRPVQYAAPAYAAGGNSYFGLGLKVIPPATDTTDIETLIATRGIRSYNVKPIRPFNPAHLYFASTVIDMTVEQVKIQGIEVFSSEEPVFIEAFSEVSRVPAIQWLTIQESTGVTVVNGNPTAGQQVAKGAFHGAYVRQ